MDLLSRKSYPRDELFRLVMLDGTLHLDNGGLQGKGIYLHKDEETVKKAFQKKIFRRFVSSMDDLDRLESEILDALRKTEAEA